jgi:hypothetical protein
MVDFPPLFAGMDLRVGPVGPVSLKESDLSASAITLPRMVTFGELRVSVLGISLQEEPQLGDILTLLSQYIILPLSAISVEYLKPFLMLQMLLLPNQVVIYETKWFDLGILAVGKTTSSEMTLSPQKSLAAAGEQIVMVISSNYSTQVGHVMASLSIYDVFTRPDPQIA